MRLLLLPVGLSLLSVGPAQKNNITVIPAYPEKLLGKWYIIRWAGTISIPREKRLEPLPPFTFVTNQNGKLEFRMHIRKPSGCQLLKLPFSMTYNPGQYTTWWKHLIFIWLLTPPSYGTAHFTDKINNQEIIMAMLFGRTLDEDPVALSLFEEFVKWKGMNETDIVTPPQADRTMKAQDMVMEEIHSVLQTLFQPTRGRERPGHLALGSALCPQQEARGG